MRAISRSIRLSSQNGVTGTSEVGLADRPKVRIAELPLDGRRGREVVPGGGGRVRLQVVRLRLPCLSSTNNCSSWPLYGRATGGPILPNQYSVRVLTRGFADIPDARCGLAGELGAAGSGDLRIGDQSFLWNDGDAMVGESEHPDQECAGDKGDGLWPAPKMHSRPRPSRTISFCLLYGTGVALLGTIQTLRRWQLAGHPSADGSFKRGYSDQDELRQQNGV